METLSLLTAPRRGLSGRVLRRAAAQDPRRECGHKLVLGRWIEQSEGAKFWLRVMNELSTAIDDLSRSDKCISGDGAAEALATHSVTASGAVISQSPAARVLPARRRPSA